MVDYLTINSELSNPYRIQILLRIAEQPLTLSELAKHLSISKPEISRHLSRLNEVGIVTKEASTRKYLPSALGETYLQLFSPIEFVLKHDTYFTNHYIDLPLNLLRNIDALSNAEMVTGPGNVLFKAQEMLDETIDEVQLMLDQRFPVGLKEKVRFGDYIVPKAMSESQSKDGIEFLKKVYEKFEIRFLDQVAHIVACSDRKKGLLSFPTLETRKADWSSCWVITDKLGLNYLQEIWGYFKGLAKQMIIQ